MYDTVKSFASTVDDPEETDYEIEQDVLRDEMLDYFGAQKDVSQIADTFLDTTNEFLGRVEELHRKYDDGRLLKLIEDVVVGSVLKNDFEYHYVVGNPPWVSKHSRYHDSAHDRRMKQQYLSAWKETDTYLQFTERGLDMLTTRGRLGFIVSNRFLYNMSGEEVRGLLAKNRIHELVDFTDVMLFEDATNYSAILSVEKRVDNDEWESFVEEGGFADRYQINAARVRDWDTDDIPGLVDTLDRREATESVDVFEIDSRRFQERVAVRNGRVEREEVSEQFTETDEADTATKRLPQVDVWPVAPPAEYDLLDRIENTMDARLGNRTVIRDNEVENVDSIVGDDIRVGVQTNGDGVYVVHPVTKISMDELTGLDTLTIQPRSVGQEFTVETELLKVDITGEDADRWLPDWDSRLVFVPYVQGDDRAELIRPTTLASEHTRTWEYFTDPEILSQLSEESIERKEIHARLAAHRGIIDDQDTQRGFRRYDLSSEEHRELSKQLRNNPQWLERQDSDLWWYRYIYRKNIESLPLPKMLTGNQAQCNKLSFDNDGQMAPHNARVYSIMLDEENREAVAAVLNSAVAEFWHQHHARIHAGKAYVTAST